MFRSRTRKTYYFTDNNLQVHEISWFRAKLAGVVLGSIVACIALLLLLNHLYYNFLDLGYNRIQTLTQENRLLQDQLVVLNSKFTDLQSSIDNLDQQGEHLRLLVDLQKIDNEAKAAGTGGVVSSADLPAAGNPVLQNTLGVLERLSREVKVQQQSYEQILNKYDFNKNYFSAFPALKPMDGYYSRAGFGMRMHPVLGIFKTHEGLDIVNDAGTPVYAAGDGVVEMSGHSGGGYGIVVVVKHGFGFQTLYAHLSKTLVREGQRVKRGDLIAKSGRTGLVSGPHLHYEVRRNGVYQNPIDFFLDDVTANEYRQLSSSR
jgi:murein DD-endopeptidase MepM/ murein hydrolase activator NlpD